MRRFPGTTIVMRRILVLATAMLLALAAAAAPSLLAKPHTHSCAGESTGNSGTVTKLKATGVGCAKAETVAEPSGDKSYGVGYTNENNYNSGGFKCKGSVGGGIVASGPWHWHCTHKKQKITFTDTF